MAQIDGAGQQDTDNQNAEALQAALAQRQVTLQGQPQGGSDVPSHENSDPVSDESEILGSVSLLPENVVYRAPSDENAGRRCSSCRNRSAGRARARPFERATAPPQGTADCLWP